MRDESKRCRVVEVVRVRLFVIQKVRLVRHGSVLSVKSTTTSSRMEVHSAPFWGIGSAMLVLSIISSQEPPNEAKRFYSLADRLMAFL